MADGLSCDEQRHQSLPVHTDRPHRVVVRRHFFDADDRVGAARHEKIEGFAHVKWLAERRSGLKDHDRVRTVSFVFPQPFDRVLHHRQMRRVIRRKVFRAHERHVAMRSPRNRGDHRIVCGDNQTIEDPRRSRVLDGMLDQRLSGERLGVLPRNPLRPAPGGNHAQARHPWSSRAHRGTGTPCSTDLPTDRLAVKSERSWKNFCV